MSALLEPSTGDNRLPALAGEIQAAHDRCRASVQEYAREAVKAGHALLEAKELVPHGQWQDWLRANLRGVGIRSAQDYMRAAKKTGKNEAASFSSLRELLRPDRPRTVERESEPDEEPGLRFGAGLLANVPPAGCAHPFRALTWTHLPDVSEAVCGRCGKAARIEYGQRGAGVVAQGILFTQAERIDPDFAKRTLSRLPSGHAPAEGALALRAEATAVVCDRADGVFHYVPGAGKPELVLEYGEEKPQYRCDEVREDGPPSLWRSWLWFEFGCPRKRTKQGAQP